MIAPTFTELETYLKHYSLDVAYWENDCGEGHLMQSHREYLEKWKSSLSLEQISELKRIDTTAKTLLNNYRGIETIDVWNLRNTVGITQE